MPLALDGEHWLPVRGYPWYEVSNLGRIARAKPGQGTWVGRILKPSQTGGRNLSYHQVRLCDEDGAHTLLVHIIVAVTWLGDERPDMTVDHINAVSTDNRVANLRWIPAVHNSWLGGMKKAHGMENYDPYAQFTEEDHPYNVGAGTDDDLPF